MTAHLEDLADRIRPRIASDLLLWTILGFIVVFAVWASFVRLDRTIHATGRIVPFGRLQIVSHLEGGIVAAILVHAGDTVYAGQPLVRLDATATGAELGSSEITVAALAAKIARLSAEVRAREPVYDATPAAAEQVGLERRLHLARMQDLASHRSAAAAHEAQAERGIAEAVAAHRAKLAARDAAERQLTMVRPLVERGIEPQMTLVQLASNAAIAASDAVQAEAAIARSRAALAEAHAAAAQVRDGWAAQAGAELAAAQSEMSARSRSVPMLADKLRRAVLTSPVSGRVNRVLVSTVGASIAAGAPVAEVVAIADALTIEASVAPKDIASIHPGQRAKINVSAYDSSIYGSMAGTVTTVSPDAVIDERTGDSHYTIRVRGDAAGFHDGTGRRLPISAGMTVDVNLLGDRRSVMAYIFTPIARVAENAARE